MIIPSLYKNNNRTNALRKMLTHINFKPIKKNFNIRSTFFFIAIFAFIFFYIYIYCGKKSLNALTYVHIYILFFLFFFTYFKTITFRCLLMLIQFHVLLIINVCQVGLDCPLLVLLIFCSPNLSRSRVDRIVEIIYIITSKINIWPQIPFSGLLNSSSC